MFALTWTTTDRTTHTAVVGDQPAMMAMFQFLNALPNVRTIRVRNVWEGQELRPRKG